MGEKLWKKKVSSKKKKKENSENGSSRYNDGSVWAYIGGDSSK